MAGLLACLLVLYWQLPRLFLPALGGWSSFRLTRLLGLLTRFSWLTWLSGIALMVDAAGSMAAEVVSTVYRDKLVFVFLLSISGMGLDLLVRRAFLAREGGVDLILGVADGLWMRFALGLSFAGFSAMGYFVYAYVTGIYSSGMMAFVATLAGCTVCAVFLLLDDRWLNGCARLTRARPGG
jgi:hypothetical protein